jgi:hypothetical protein
VETNLSTGQAPFANYNPGSTFGAVIGGAVGGYYAPEATAALMLDYGLSETGAAILQPMITGAPSVFTGSIFGGMYSSGSTGSTAGSSPTK